MAIPAVNDVLLGAAALLGDSAQQQFTNAVLLPWYSQAYREAYNLAIGWGLPVATHDAYCFLAANSVSLTPAQASISNMGEPIALWARPNIGTFTITNVTNATPMVVTTSAPHGLGSGSPVEIYGVVGVVGVNQQWRVTVVSPTTFSLIGSAAGGAYTSGGTVISGGEESSNPFYEVCPVQNLPQIPEGPTINYWRWIQDTFRFVASTADLELWIEYSSSGDPPQSGTVGWDNCQNFLQTRTAALIAGAYDMPGTAAAQTMISVGPSGQPDGSGGALRGFMNPMLRNKQLIPKRPQPFRRRSVAYGRNAGYGGF